MNQTPGLRRPMGDAHETPMKGLVALDSRTWPWKSEFAKECVTTHRPKQLALKIWNDAPALGLYRAATASFPRGGLRRSE
ncbi:hypothetical protein JTE90_023351 [Oedothorax gibbosus]|uniref:Uncharacterized protein n=1 Tax=Oedothorax gibbosus TaxID=931172 RepID=A0AAV6TIG0_9ARAC|nr:hypothetical protein JTE90_023351 [Oedothorax gibbosus]